MQVEQDLTAWRRAAILATTTTATGLYAMTVTIANVSLPQIQGALSATQDQIAWIVTFNIVATAVATPMTGWLVARFGQRRVMVWGVIGFTAMTLACGLASSLAELVLYRVAQGMFGAPLVPLSQAIVLASYPQERHGFATTVFGVGVVLGPIFAPTVGGYLSETYNWRWVFFMVVPFGVICLFGVLAFIRERKPDVRPRLDWTGFLALSIAIACFQLVLDRGERNDWFESHEILAEAAIALGALYVFITHTLTAERPFLSPQMLKDRNYAIGLLITLLFGMLNFTPMVLFPTMLQGLQGYPDSVIGLLLGARAIGTLVGFGAMFFASKYDPRIWLFVGFSLQGWAGFRATTFHAEVPTWEIAVVSAMQGLGVGFLWVPITLVTFATLNPRYLAEATAVFHLLRNIGSSIHISLSVAVLVHTSKINYAEIAANVTPYAELFRFPQVAEVWSPSNQVGIRSLSGEITRQAAMIGYVNAFYLYALTALVVLPLIFLVRRGARQR